MSGEERQRILRRAGGEPAEAERQEGARASREQATAEDAAREAADDAAVEPTPVAESGDGPARPRR